MFIIMGQGYLLLFGCIFVSRRDTYCLGHYLLVLVVGGHHQRPPLHTLTLVKYIPWHLHSSLIKYILRDVIVFTLSSCNVYHMRAKGSSGGLWMVHHPVENVPDINAN